MGDMTAAAGLDEQPNRDPAHDVAAGHLQPAVLPDRDHAGELLLLLMRAAAAAPPAPQSRAPQPPAPQPPLLALQARAML